MRQVAIALLTLLAGAAIQPFVDKGSGAVLMLVTIAASAIVAITSQPVRSRTRRYRVRSPLVRTPVETPLPIPPLLPKWATTSAPMLRVFLPENVTPAYLLALGDGMLSAQRKALREPFIGKWMRVEAVVDDVALHMDDETMVYATYSAEPRARVSLRFEAAWKDRVLSLIRGSRVTAIGELQGISDAFDSVDLRLCELEVTGAG